VLGTNQHSGKLMIAAPVQLSVSLQHLLAARRTESQMYRRPYCAAHDAKPRVNALYGACYKGSEGGFSHCLGLKSGVVRIEGVFL
jgi:hypothetical protein